MIRLPNIPLPGGALASLSEYQQEVDSLPDYATRVAHAKERFAAVNRKGNRTFDSVKETLSKMNSGARRCAYCEDSLADEVEHIRPKTLYPELVFAWMNYLYACGSCNGHKNDRFAVFAAGTGVLTSVARARKAPVVPPIVGGDVFIDPRIEDPAEYLSLDLLDTFWFIPRPKLGSVEQARAEYTIRELHLNSRDMLPLARRSAYRDYLAHLKSYIHDKGRGMPQAHLNRLADDVRGRQHPFVWIEMKRQHAALPELTLAFAAAPEALDW
ncbi:HNH endonuclease family protein [Pyxidicoccus xibeiensis]|uniref:hypothetical protein n=1 Tax=Pyxidicoccus xibeiensis TaxID=2906759 RepID=UPI0020A80195|nr:hypothetical protein [Pyxidicoccus xibeiensis]MCP3143042.1 hypothetical protein [Pyxidicoccus xibeiensis]